MLSARFKGGNNMTPNKEDYIKAIYKLGGNHEIISNKSITNMLQISAASTTEMLNKLVAENYVVYERYKGARLTEKGILYAEGLIRTHKIWEVFLVQSLGFSPDEVHAQAEILEHASSPELINRLMKFLDDPTHCPHGEVIPKIHES